MKKYKNFLSEAQRLNLISFHPQYNSIFYYILIYKGELVEILSNTDREQLWKSFYKIVLYNKYYKTFQKFKNGYLLFFDSISDYKDKLKTLLRLNFQLFLDKIIKALAYS